MLLKGDSIWTKSTLQFGMNFVTKKKKVRRIYPEGIHRTIAKGIAADDLNIRLASLDEPEHDLTNEVIASTDVLIWWGALCPRQSA